MRNLYNALDNKMSVNTQLSANACIKMQRHQKKNVRTEKRFFDKWIVPRQRTRDERELIHIDQSALKNLAYMFHFLKNNIIKICKILRIVSSARQNYLCRD